MTVHEIAEDDDLIFVSDSQDTEEFKKQYPEYDSFFVKMLDGDYTEIYGMTGIVPYYTKQITKLL